MEQTHIIWIVSAVVIIGIIGIIVYCFVGTKKTEEEVKKTPVTTTTTPPVRILTVVDADNIELLVQDTTKTTFKDYITGNKSVYIGTNIEIDIIKGHTGNGHYHATVDGNTDYRYVYKIITQNNNKMTVECVIYKNSLEIQPTNNLPPDNIAKYKRYILSNLNDTKYNFKVMKSAESTGLTEDTMKKLVTDKETFLVLFTPSDAVKGIINGANFGLNKTQKGESYIITQKHTTS